MRRQLGFEPGDVFDPERSPPPGDGSSARRRSRRSTLARRASARAVRRRRRPCRRAEALADRARPRLRYRGRRQRVSRARTTTSSGPRGAPASASRRPSVARRSSASTTSTSSTESPGFPGRPGRVRSSSMGAHREPGLRPRARRVPGLDRRRPPESRAGRRTSDLSSATAWRGRVSDVSPTSRLRASSPAPTGSGPDARRRVGLPRRPLQSPPRQPTRCPWRRRTRPWGNVEFRRPSSRRAGSSHGCRPPCSQSRDAWGWRRRSATQSLPIEDRFFAGGSTSVRGFPRTGWARGTRPGPGRRRGAGSPEPGVALRLALGQRGGLHRCRHGDAGGRRPEPRIQVGAGGVCASRRRSGPSGSTRPTPSSRSRARIGSSSI